MFFGNTVLIEQGQGKVWMRTSTLSHFSPVFKNLGCFFGWVGVFFVNATRLPRDVWTVNGHLLQITDITFIPLFIKTFWLV
jgi:hypothetical protein